MELKLLLLSAFCLVSIARAWELKPENTVAFVGKSVTIRCRIEKDVNDTEQVIHTWEKGELLFFNNLSVQADNRMSVGIADTEMSVTIKKVELTDEGEYECKLLALTPPIHGNPELVVYRKPELSIENVDDPVTAGQSATVATCTASRSKPVATLWFTDASGRSVGDAVQQDSDNGDGTFDTTLTLTRKFSAGDDGEKYTCHAEVMGEEVMERTKSVEVLYPPTVSLSDPSNPKLLEEEQSFYVECIADGNPSPTITWAFTPASEINVTLPDGQDLPSNFDASDGVLESSAVAVTTSDSTNNGTFTCMASNGIGAAVSKSFTLGVYALPVTTVATTPALTETSTSPPDSTAAAIKTGGSDAAVIGGVVAVAVFVLIVAIVLVVRYFTSHKGTYRTNETKARDFEADRGVDDDRSLMDDEINKELGGKKRTEYFM